MARSSRADTERFEALKRQIVDIGLIRRGSLIRRFMPCGKPGCRCQAEPPQLHGPYYQWTQKVGGKTVTVRIRPGEARFLAEWIQNGRRLNRVVGELERISYRVTENLLREARDAEETNADRRGRRVSHRSEAPSSRRTGKRLK
jgi:hypothetical protein